MTGIMDWWRKKVEPKPPAGPTPPVHIDLYDVLRVTPKATNDDIKAAFRSLALMFHPDRNQDDPVAAKKYAEISSAYAILGDDAQRAVYDRLRAQAAPPPPPPPPISRGMIPRPETRDESGRVTRKEPGKAPAPPEGQTSMWEGMFSRPEEKKGPTGSVFDVFAQEAPPPPEIPSAKNPFSWAAPFHKKVPLTPSVDTPAPNELFYQIEHEWPLEEVWGVARQGRHTQEFYKTRSMAIDILGGGGQTPAELDMADRFGIPLRQVDEFILNRGRDAFFGEILHPIFDQVTQIMGQLKPVDLPGQFFLGWDDRGRVIMLIYSESVGRRPWE